MQKQVLKTYKGWNLVEISEMSYFKNGKANLHMARRYHIQNEDPEIITGIFNIKTKKEALKEWSQFKKTHSIGGAELKEECFK